MEPLGWTNGTGVCVSSFQIGAITISFTLEIPGEVRIMGGFLFLGGSSGTTLFAGTISGLLGYTMTKIDK